jgi:hypothetical protein
MSTKARRGASGKRIINDLIKRAKTLSGLRTKQDILSSALKHYLEYLKRNGAKTEKSFYELTKHLAGSIEGPTDLAHNKKYLQGFGQ